MGKFAPLGQRGFDSGNPDNPYCFVPPAEYIEQANAETFIIIQLESPAAVEKADEIAQVEGVDAIVLGPADFSILAGIPGQFTHPMIDDALRKIAAATAAAGKHWGCPGTNASCARNLSTAAPGSSTAARTWSRSSQTSNNCSAIRAAGR